MKQWLKKNFGLLYIALLTLALAVILIRSDELPRMLRILGSLHAPWVLIAFSFIALYLIVRALTLHFYLRRNLCRLRFVETLMVSCIGQFYSAVTPSASGGQPLQVLALHRRGVPVSIASAALSVKFVAFQLAVMLTGGVLWTARARVVALQLGPVRWLVALGYLINALLLFALLTAMVNRKAVDALLSWAIRATVKLRLTRHPERVREKADRLLDEYRRNLFTLKSRPADALAIFLLSVLQVILLMGVICCLYHAFGLSGTDDLSILTFQFLLFLTAAFVPLPGAAGAQEGGFYLFFRGLIPEESLVSLMVCWRFFTYYLLLAFGLAGVIADGLTAPSLRAKEESPDDGNDP